VSKRTFSLEHRRRVTDAGCWEWTGYVNPHVGYGMYRTETHNLYVHRMAYEELVGPIPEGLVLHHTCENRICFNPAHLEPITRSDHIKKHPEVSRWTD